jgi:protein-tyrosine phosphatase
MAEYYFRHIMNSRIDLDVDSAGTSVFLHSSASTDTLNVLKEENIDARDHLSQPISTIQLKKADLIFCMTTRHRAQVLEWCPEVEKRVYLLREFTQDPPSLQSDMDIPDPIGKPYGEYKRCFEVIKDALHKIKTLV